MAIFIGEEEEGSGYGRAKTDDTENTRSDGAYNDIGPADDCGHVTWNQRPYLVSTIGDDQHNAGSRVDVEDQPGDRRGNRLISEAAPDLR